MFTTQAFRIALTTAALCAAATTADAKPNRVVILDFDGPRTLADDGRSTVLDVVGEKYDVVATKRWLEAKAAASRNTHGPKAWSIASKKARVDAVIEGWINDEGRAKVLTIVITDASTGTAYDQLTIRLPSRGFTAETERKLREGIEERFDWIEPIVRSGDDVYEPYRPTSAVKDKRRIGAKRRSDDRVDDSDEYEEIDEEALERPRRRRKARRTRRDDRYDERDDERDDEVTEKRVATIETRTSKEDSETAQVQHVLLPPDEVKIVTDNRITHVPKLTSKFRVSGGGYYGSRNLYIGAENPTGVMQYASVPNKGLAVDAAFYPFPRQKVDGILSGVGFSLSIGKSMGGIVTFVEEEQSTDLPINEQQWHAGVHYRAALGSSFAIDGEVGYGSQTYQIIDAPEEFEVPDTHYTYLTAGGSLDLRITERASVGFGAKYLYTLGTGDLNSTDWYGPGTSSGYRFGGDFIIPLPSRLFVKGELVYTRIKTTFDGIGGPITEEEGVYEAIDSTVAGGVKLGIEF